MLIAIAIVVILLVAALTIFVTASRRRVDDRNAVARDARARPVATRGRRADAVRRRPRSRRPVAAGRRRPRPTSAARWRPRSAADVVEWEPVDEEELGVSRRQFLNRAVLGVSGFSAAALGIGDPRLPLADRLERLRRQGERRQASTTSSPRSTTSGSRTTSRKRRPTCDPYPTEDAARGEEGAVVQAACCPAWSRASSPCTSGACTSVAASRGARRRSGSSARATDRSTTRSARRRPVPHPAGSTASSWPSPAATVDDRHGRRHHRSADRHQHHQAGAGRAIVRLTPAGRAQAAGPERPTDSR